MSNLNFWSVMRARSDGTFYVQSIFEKEEDAKATAEKLITDLTKTVPSEMKFSPEQIYLQEVSLPFELLLKRLLFPTKPYDGYKTSILKAIEEKHQDIIFLKKVELK